MLSKKMCMQHTCRVRTTVTGGKLVASKLHAGTAACRKLHAGLRSNGFWPQENCARKKGENKGKLKALGKQG